MSNRDVTARGFRNTSSVFSPQTCPYAVELDEARAFVVGVESQGARALPGMVTAARLLTEMQAVIDLILEDVDGG